MGTEKDGAFLRERRRSRPFVTASLVVRPACGRTARLVTGQALPCALSREMRSDLHRPRRDMLETIAVYRRRQSCPNAVVDEASEGSHTVVVGNWTAANAYSLPIVGSIDTNVPRTSPPSLRFIVHGSNHTTAFFGNHTDCTLDALL